MNEEMSFVPLGILESIESLREDVEKITNDEWLGFKDRKNRGGAASANTDTIPLLWGKVDTLASQEEHEHMSIFSKYVDEVAGLGINKYGESDIKRAFFARLRAGGKIPRHKDVGTISKKTHRIHVPVVTSPGCVFTVGDELMHIPYGEVWVIDNTDRYHSIENNSNIDRIHLIVDIG